MSIFRTLRFITSHPLNQPHKLRSLARFVRWQVGSRLLPGPVVYTWVNGSRFLASTGETGLTGNIYTGLHEFPDMGFLLHFLRPEDLFVDVGANVGSYTILACSAIGARGYAFEPVPATFRRLVENLRLNHLEDRVACLNIGVAAGHGHIEFTCDSNTMNHAIAPSELADRSITVEVMSLDAALLDETPVLLKIDVEGFETRVLEGAQETLQRPTLNALIIELNGAGNRYGFKESAILEMMSDHGFGTYSYEPRERSLIPLHGKNPISGNTLFIRDQAYVVDRLRSAPRFSVDGSQL